MWKISQYLWLSAMLGVVSGLFSVDAYGQPARLNPLPADLAPVPGAPIEPQTKLPMRLVAEKLSQTDARLELVLITPGRFVFGADSADLQPSEFRETDGTLPDAFYISQTEVTNAQYAAFAKQVGAKYAGTAWKTAQAEIAAHAGLHPVVNVSIDQAMAFCRWLAENGRLPAEREWERAARGGTSRLYPWLDGMPPDVRRCRLNFDLSKPSTTAPVDQFPDDVTPDGLRHTLGNVAEWCSDVYTAGHGDAQNSFPGIGQYHVIRGGSFKEADRFPKKIRLTTRANAPPDGANDVGFRVVVPVTRR